jgi:UDP-glucose 4-epimerase
MPPPGDRGQGAKMKLFITGGSGFIGRNIIEQMSSVHKILAPTHKELDLLDEDAVRKYFSQNNIDIVIHCAVRPGHRNAKDPSNQLYHNTRMFFNIACNSERFNKMIYLGSGLAYDIRHYQPKMKEDYFGVHVPVDEGGFSKFIISKYIEKSENIYDLRIFGIFGKYEDYSIRFISNAVCKSIFGLPITIRQNRKFDYIAIEDLLPILEYFMNRSPRHKAYNITPDTPIDLVNLAGMVKTISGKDVPVIVHEEGIGAEYSGSNARLREEISDINFTDIKASISALYRWYEDNKTALNREFLLYDK